MRAFVALDIPEVGDGSGLAHAPADAPRHFTLRFLGEIGPGPLSEVERRLAAVGTSMPPFPLEIAGVGAFPNWERPRIVYLSVGAGRVPLERLASAVRSATEDAGLPPEDRPFVPHVTVLRVRSLGQAEAGRRFAGSVGDRILARMSVTEFSLKESELRPEGARHRVLARYALSGPG